MKYIQTITDNVKKVATVAVMLGALVAALTAFTDYWEINISKKDKEA